MEEVEVDENVITVGRILEINEAVKLVENNDYLDGTISYRLGRLGDKTNSIARSFQKQRDKKMRLLRDEQQKNNEEIRLTADEATKKMYSSKNLIAQDKFQDDINAIIDSALKEDITFPKLKLSDFIAKDDIKNKEGVVIYRKGQALVSVKFFSIMGDLIEDDKNER